MLTALDRCMTRLEARGATESLARIAGMSDDELHRLAALEVRAVRRVVHPPSLSALIAEAAA